jgi:hypothetical protein
MSWVNSWNDIYIAYTSDNGQFATIYHFQEPATNSDANWWCINNSCESGGTGCQTFLLQCQDVAETWLTASCTTNTPLHTHTPSAPIPVLRYRDATASWAVGTPLGKVTSQPSARNRRTWWSSGRHQGSVWGQVQGLRYVNGIQPLFLLSGIKISSFGMLLCSYGIFVLSIVRTNLKPKTLYSMFI